MEFKLILSDANKLYYGIDWSRDGIRFQGDDKGIYDVHSIVKPLLRILQM